MNFKIKHIILALVILFSAGCNYTSHFWYSSSIEVSEENEKLVMNVYEHLYNRELEQVANLSVDGMSIQYLELLEDRFIAWFPKDPIADMNIVGASKVVTNGTETKLNIGLQVRHKKNLCFLKLCYLGLKVIENLKVSKFAMAFKG